ncbi:uncharacterized protein LOC122194500 [Lactuca sativa]|uniref:uncharacterized protein LOC122194500 n=1 Tax=Lactuca sativa TaxID=4236 RepID=UPI001C68CDCF|nr:uncharacterized protein LOC122194500 [Lactuca sativa]
MLIDRTSQLHHSIIRDRPSKLKSQTISLHHDIRGNMIFPQSFFYLIIRKMKVQEKGEKLWKNGGNHQSKRQYECHRMGKRKTDGRSSLY